MDLELHKLFFGRQDEAIAELEPCDIDYEFIEQELLIFSIVKAGSIIQKYLMLKIIMAT